FNPAISLHGVADESRSALIPTTPGLAEILDAAKYYFEKTRREDTFAYTLVGCNNGDLATARKLAALRAGFPKANVNLIPMTPVEGSGLQTPATEAVEAFTQELQRAGVNVHVRRRRGRNVQAACGQLRLKLEG